MSPAKPNPRAVDREQIEAHLIDRAVKDKGFRKELVSNPRRVLEKEIGIKFPADFQLKVVEETPKSLCLVLPMPAGELSDLQLEAVAGGKRGWGFQAAAGHDQPGVTVVRSPR